jgi:hypothetical protein
MIWYSKKWLAMVISDIPEELPEQANSNRILSLTVTFRCRIVWQEMHIK